MSSTFPFQQAAPLTLLTYTFNVLHYGTYLPDSESCYKTCFSNRFIPNPDNTDAAIQIRSKTPSPNPVPNHDHNHNHNHNPIHVTLILILSLTLTFRAVQRGVGSISLQRGVSVRGPRALLLLGQRRSAGTWGTRLM